MPAQKLPIRRRRSARRKALYAQLTGVAAAVIVLATLTTVAVQFVRQRPAHVNASASTFTPPPVPAAATPSPSPPPEDAALKAKLAGIVAATDGHVGIEVVDLKARPQIRVRVNADDTFDAASTYKLPLLMANAEAIASGTYKTSDRICFQSSEQEDGWFEDYNDGDCFTRQTLAMRVGKYSDNTAAHMLLDNLGGATPLNAYAQSRGAVESGFFVPNNTTAADLASLLVAEATGRAGGQAAQSWLYPLLTQTAFENGLPAGLPSGVTVAHKVGAIDEVIDDAGIVTGAGGSYVISVMSDGVGGDAGYALVAQISAAVWAAEASA
jgi:beta-lactamase class A